MDTRSVQAWVAAHGIDVGPIDGKWGPKTKKGVAQYNERYSDQTPLGRRKMWRIVMHWTAGGGVPNATDRKHYHVIVADDATVTMGDLKPEANINTADGQYAAHTRALNTGSIGISMAAMALATERPFNAGAYPITERQLDAFVNEVADLAETYDIPISKYTVLSHSEVQTTLNVRQRGKWDINWLPGMVEPGGPVEVGDELRRRIIAASSAKG